MRNTKCVRRGEQVITNRDSVSISHIFSPLGDRKSSNVSKAKRLIQDYLSNLKRCCYFGRTAAASPPQINHMLHGLETLWNMEKQDHPANSSNLTIYADMLKVSHGLTLALHSHHHILFWKCSLKKLSL